MSYHHGDLPATVLRAVASIVADDGINAVTLRAVARRAGVSHTAPAHHFGDKTGLLTAFATEGCQLLRDRITRARDDPANVDAPLLAIGVAYVTFALRHPEHFAVMFRHDYVRNEDPKYQHARTSAFDVLVEGVRAVRPELADDEEQLLRAATGAWSMVHGISQLWLDGNLPEEITADVPEKTAAAIMQAWGETVFVLTVNGANGDEGGADT